MALNKEQRIAIYKATVETVFKGFYSDSKGSQVHIDGLDDYMVNRTKYYDRKALIDHSSLPRYETEIKVIDNDTIYAAKELLDRGLKPAVLNMASFHTPGGGVIKGSSAQEENIFRRSNIFKSLYQYHDIGIQYGVTQRAERYPLDFNYGGIYTPKVIVFRKSDESNYEFLDEPYYVDVITVPAVKNPKIENEKIVHWVEIVIKNKIKQILNIALENGNDSLVLSAFGCGAYGTPPEQMARFFADVLASEKYEGLFKVIHFAIINLPSTNGSHNPNGNLQPFKNVFG